MKTANPTTIEEALELMQRTDGSPVLNAVIFMDRSFTEQFADSNNPYVGRERVTFWKDIPDQLRDGIGDADMYHVQLVKIKKEI